jgi:Mn-dependent DtxR family transcriptional regulator
MFVRADDIAEDLDVSRPYAYKLIRELNAELQAKGYMTVAGRVSRQFYEEKFYGIARVTERS